MDGSRNIFLIIIHHVLNIRWFRGLFKGCYSKVRMFTTLLNGLLIFIILALLFSSVVLSRHVFPAAALSDFTSPARLLHLAASYWGYVLMSIHIGVHVRLFMGMTKKTVYLKAADSRWKVLIYMVAGSISVYAVYVLFKRKFLEYMFLKTQFAFFDYDEKVSAFIADYFAVMVLFAGAGYVLTKILGKNQTGILKRSKKERE